MRKLVTHLFSILPLLALIFGSGLTNAQQPYAPAALQDFETSIRDVTEYTNVPYAHKRLTFDIYLLDTDPSQDFVLATYQAGIYVNPGIFAPGAVVTVELEAGSSNLIPAQVPISVQFNSPYNLLKLAGRVPPGPGSPGSPAGTIISKTGYGTRIIRVVITSDQPFVPNSQPNLAFYSSTAGIPNYATRVAHYDYTNAVWNSSASQWTVPPVNTQLAVVPGSPGEPGTNAHVYENPVLNSGAIVCPEVFNVTGSGSYCQNDDGVAVGLDGSETDVNYTLFKDGVETTTVLSGTGQALDFGPQTAGVYTIFATNDDCPDPIQMNGSASITEEPREDPLFPNFGPYCQFASAPGLPTTSDNGYAGTWNPPAISTNVPGTFSFTFTPDAGQCANAYTMQVVINEAVTSGVSISASSNNVCEGTEVTFTATPVNGGDFPTFTWFVNGEQQDGPDHAGSFTYTPADNDEVYVVLTPDVICPASGDVTSNTIYMNVNPVVTPSITISANPAGAVTPGTIVTVSATVVNGGDNPQIDWYVNGDYAGSFETFNIQPEDGDEVYAVLTSDAPCASPATATSNTITMVVEEIILPPSAFTVTGGGSYCEGGSGIEVGLSGSETGVVYTLYKDGSSAGTFTGTGNSLSFGLQLAGVYTASGTNAAGTTSMNGSVTVVENPLPSVTCPDDATFCSDQAPVVLDGALPTGGVYTGTGVIGGEFDPATAGPGDHIITYYYEDANGCSASCSFTFTVTQCATGCLETTWTGAVDNNWFDPGNWSDCVPADSTNVTIPGGLANYPTLESAAECHDILIQDGGSFIGAEYLTVGGNAEVLRYFANSDFHFVSSPVTSVNFGTVFPLNQDAVWARQYHEDTGEWENLFVYNYLTPGIGYSIEMTEPQMAHFPGEFNKTDQLLTLSRLNTSTDPNRVAWNLLGNPFQSAISWDLISSANRAIVADSRAVYIWSGSQYLSYVDGVGSLTDGIIPAQNGFFTQAVFDGEQFEIPLSARVHSNIPFYKSSLANVLELGVEGNNYSDLTYVRFRDEATPQFDFSYDAFKLWGLEKAPQLYSIVPGSSLSVNSLPFEGNETVNLGFFSGAAGNYVITASGMESFDAAIPVLLEDLKLNIIQDLRKNPVYDFTYSTGDDNARFRLHFKSATGISEPALGGIQIYSYDHTVVITNTTGLSGEVFIYDLSGREIAVNSLSSRMTTTIPVNAVIGTYIVKVITEKGIANQKVFIR